MMRALALMALLLGATATSHAGLVVSNPSFVPGSAGSGSSITVFVQVNNTGTANVLGVSTTVQAVGNGVSANVLAPASPVTQNISASSSTVFTWVFQSNGCGLLYFSAAASGYDTANSQTTTAAPASGGPSLVNCTPTQTPTASPSSTVTPVVTATPTSTATPWIIYVNPPTTGDASIPGNLFHPNEGQPLQLKFDAPAEGPINIDLFNRLGQRVRSITRSVQPGSYTELWDGRSDQGLLVASGIYVAQFRGKGLFKTVKFAVIK